MSKESVYDVYGGIRYSENIGSAPGYDIKETYICPPRICIIYLDTLVDIQYTLLHNLCGCLSR